MTHCPVASMTSTFSLSSRFRSPGSWPTLRMRFPLITMALFGVASAPDPSIRVPLRITVCFPPLTPMSTSSNEFDLRQIYRGFPKSNC